MTASCGVYDLTWSGGFFGRELRIAVNATSRACFNWNINFTMSR